MSSTLTREDRSAVIVGGLVAVVALLGWMMSPRYAAFIVIVAALVNAGIVALVVRHPDIPGHGTEGERLAGAIVAGSWIIIAAAGYAVVDGGTDSTVVVIPGLLTGALTAVGMVILDDLAEDRPRIAATILALWLVIGLIAALRGIGHLIGVAIHDPQATLAASAYVGSIVVLGVYVGVRLSLTGVGTPFPGFRHLFGGR